MEYDGVLARILALLQQERSLSSGRTGARTPSP